MTSELSDLVRLGRLTNNSGSNASARSWFTQEDTDQNERDYSRGAHNFVARAHLTESSLSKILGS